MRYPLTVYAGIALFAGLAVASVCRAQSQTAPPAQSQPQPNADSPADAAAKSKDANSSIAPKKVYTNDDLRSAPRSEVSVVGNNKAASKAGKSTATNNDAKNEQYWRGKAQTLRNQMAEVDRQIAQEKAANQTNGSVTTGTNSPPPAPLSAYTNSAHARAGTQLQKLEDRKTALQGQWDQLEEEARKAGVPPGWLR
jgi:multidrug efflux pump subunit AcrB